MNLTTAQKQILKADIDASFPGAPDTNAQNQAIADAYNADASPDYWCLKSALSQAELQGQTSGDGTSFDWASAGGFIARAQGERDAYRTMFALGTVDPSKASVRTAYADIFSGSGVGAVANRNHFNAMNRRKATRCEKVFAVDTPGSGAGRGTTADPDTFVLEGTLTMTNVEEARHS